MMAGGVFGFTRLAMGAHFLSDIIYAAFFMLVTVAAVHAAMYGRKETVERWKGFFSLSYREREDSARNLAAVSASATPVKFPG